MNRDLTRLAERSFDLLVIGGGIHGLAAAYDAAQRGLAVALVERDDFGSAASSNHLKTVHGGLRYLQTADLKRMRESILERRTVARLAPHLLTPLPFLMPTYWKLTRSRLAMRVAFLADAVIGRDRNDGVAARLRLPAGRIISRAECLRLFPDVRAKGLTGGATWFDYQMRNTDRLTFAFALAAAREGACLANHLEAQRALTEGKRVVGARVRDVLTGDEFDVRARVTLNAAGAGAGRLMSAFGVAQSFPLLKAMNLVTRRPMSGPALASSTDDGRMLFVVPWNGLAVAGTSHSQEMCDVDASAVSTQELQKFIDEVNQAFPALRLTPDDVTLVHRGIVPASKSRRGEIGLEGHYGIRDHAREGVEGAVSLIGVKYTTARGVAAEAVNLVVRKAGRIAACRTADVPLPGGDGGDLDVLVAGARRQAPEQVDDESLRQIVETYGSGTDEVFALARSQRALAGRVSPDAPVIRAQVVHAIRSEMACSLVDVVTRRLPLGAGRHPGQGVAEGCVAVMAGELIWSQSRVEQELLALEQFYAPVRLL
ncbi:MAG TPA: glycerol-3-phosphate dehydrogenase/oxidase [Vicinamibacterales bacterium]|jgi:glycerol-3-phosphate dehydrogenase